MGMNVRTKITIERQPSTIWRSSTFSTSSFSGAVLNPINAIIAAQKNQPDQKYPNGKIPKEEYVSILTTCYRHTDVEKLQEHGQPHSIWILIS